MEFGCQVRKDGKHNQKEIVRHAENLCSRLPKLSNRRDADEGHILLWGKAKKSGMKHNQRRSICKWTECTMKRRNKGLKSSEVARMEIKVRGTTDWQGWCVNCCHNNRLLMLILICLMATPWNLTISCHYLRRW